MGTRSIRGCRFPIADRPLYLLTLLDTSSAYLLVSHGSRDPRPAGAIVTLRDLMHEALAAPSPRLMQGNLAEANLSPVLPPLPLIATAALECASLPLHEQIWQFAATVIAQGRRHMQIVPLFLLPGVHVKADIPEQLAIAQQRLGATVTLTLCPFLGSHAGLQNLVADRLTACPADAYILLSHGSRRSGGNAPVEAMAQQVGAVAAYWSVAPSLATQVQALAARGHQRLAIFPYFMFPGAIGDAIAQQIAQLVQQSPTLQLTLLAPLAADRELAQLVVALTQP